MSAVNGAGYSIRKGAADAIAAWVREQGGTVPQDLDEQVSRVARVAAAPEAQTCEARGNTPRTVAASRGPE